jgi:probable phosphoglycerate mutase
MTFPLVLTSPLARAKRTCELAGFGGVAIEDRDLVEWNYGDYEGKRTVEILAGRPGGSSFATAARAANRRRTSARAPTA